MTDTRPAMAILGKTPRLGTGKTRLQPPLTAVEAFALQVACIEDLCDKLAPLQSRFEIRFFQSEAGPLPQACDRYRKEIQASGDLGQKMAAAARSLFAGGHRPVLILGTDLPHLDPALPVEAARLLLQCPVTIGPTLDGGYYLLGLREFYPALFEDITWSTGAVFQETERRLRQCSLEYELLPPDFDLDRPEDLERFLNSPARTSAPRTLAFLEEWKTREKDGRERPQSGLR